MRSTSNNPYAKPTRVILVRHGRSTFNEQGRYQGSSDEAVLTAKGLQDSFQTGLALQHLSFGAIYTSPLQRTHQTAEQILTTLQSDGLRPALGHRPILIATHPDLKEIDLPQWAGRSYLEVRNNLVEDYRCWIEQPQAFVMGKKCPVQDLYAQAQRFWEEVLPRHSGQTILVVSHGGTIRALLSTALGIDCRYFHSLQQSNCGISELCFQSGQVALEILNDTQHLGEILPKLKAGKQGLRLLLVPDTTNPVQGLQTQLNGVEIDFSVSHGSAAQPLTQQLLRRHSQTVQLQSNHTDLSRLWLSALDNRQRSQQGNTSMTTGLVVAQPNLVLDMISHVMGSTPNLLSLAPGGINIVHYPQSQTLPILQALNFAESAPSQGDLIPCAS